MIWVKRYIVFGALTLGFLLAALLLGCARRSITRENMRDFAAEAFRGSAETRFAQFAAYLTEEDYLTPDGMMGLKNDLISSSTEFQGTIINGRWEPPTGRKYH